MLILPDGSLLLNSANQHVSTVLRYASCSADGTRASMGGFITPDASSGLSHPYGLAADADGSIYVSNQDTDVVLRFFGLNTAQPGQPMPAVGGGQYPGSFFQLNDGAEGVRGVAYDSASSLMWIADEQLGLYALNSTGDVVGHLDMASPIALFAAGDGFVYVSSSTGDNSAGFVYAVSSKTFSVVTSFTADSLAHPSGIVVNDGTLYVASHTNKSIMSFDVKTGKQLGTVVDNLPDNPEGLILSMC